MIDGMFLILIGLALVMALVCGSFDNEEGAVHPHGGYTWIAVVFFFAWTIVALVLQ